jgi:hypothetical protein
MQFSLEAGEMKMVARSVSGVTELECMILFFTLKAFYNTKFCLFQNYRKTKP